MVHQLTLSARLALIALLLAAAGCSKPPPPALQKGKPVFKFDYTRVSRLEIAKDDPATGDRWSAAFIRNPETGIRTATRGWTITSGPETADLGDRLADGKFIEHLLDTLANLRVSETLPSDGSASTLGLSPPRYWLRWSEGERTFELRLGARVDSFSTFGEVDGNRASLEGAALRMLDYLGGFERIRFHKLMTWNLDEADRVSIRMNGKTLLEAERNSGDWSRSDGGRLKASLTPLLEKIAHLELAEFRSAPKAPFPEARAPWLVVQWKSRKDASLRLEILEKPEGKAALGRFARASDRAGSVFVLMPGAEASLMDGIRNVLGR